MTTLLARRTRGNRRLFIISGALIAFASAESVLAQQTGTVAGHVTQSDGVTPVPGASVSLLTGGVLAVTDRAGLYVIHLIPGDRRVKFEALGYESVERPIRVAAGSSATLDVTLAPAPIQIAGIRVSGVSRWSEEVVYAPAAVSVVAQERIADLAVTGQVPRLIAELPGVHAAQSGVHDYNLNARGFNTLLARRLLVLVDGRDVSLPILGNQEWSALSVMEDGAQVEMIRGPGSALYGANAFNGVIKIVTPTARDAQGTRISTGGGGLGTFRTDFRHAGVTESNRWGYRVNAGYYRSESWDRSRTNLGDLEREYGGIDGITVVPPAPGFELKALNGQTKEGAFGLPGSVTGTPDPVRSVYGSARLDRYSDDGALFTVEVGTSSVRNQVFTTSLGRSQVNSASRPWARLAWTSDLFKATASYSGRSSDDQFILASGGRLRESSSTLDLEGYRDGTFRGDRGKFVFGASVRSTSIDSEGTLLAAKDDGRSDEYYGLFGQIEYKVHDKLKFVLAGRYDEGTLFDAQLSPKAAVVFTPSEGHAIRLTVNRAFQTASALEYFLDLPAGPPLDLSALEGGLRASPLGAALAGIADGTLFTNSSAVPLLALGNEDLKPTEVTSFEAGYKGRLGQRTFVTVDAFYSELDNFVTNVLPGVNPFYAPWTAPSGLPAEIGAAVEEAAIGTLGSGLTRLPDGQTAVVVSIGNAGQATEWGLELGAGTLVTDEVRLDANYTYFDSDVKTSTFVEGDSILPNTPSHRANLSATFDSREFRARVGLSLVSSFDWAAGTLQGEIPSSQSVDINLRYRVDRRLSVGVVGTNVFDQRQYHVFGGSLVGRRILTSVTWEY